MVRRHHWSSLGGGWHCRNGEGEKQSPTLSPGRTSDIKFRSSCPEKWEPLLYRGKEGALPPWLGGHHLLLSHSSSRLGDPPHQRPTSPKGQDPDRVSGVLMTTCLSPGPPNEFLLGLRGWRESHLVESLEASSLPLRLEMRVCPA